VRCYVVFDRESVTGLVVPLAIDREIPRSELFGERHVEASVCLSRLRRACRRRRRKVFNVNSQMRLPGVNGRGGTSTARNKLLDP
jgi:hypothetical protein